MSQNHRPGIPYERTLPNIPTNSPHNQRPVNPPPRSPNYIQPQQGNPQQFVNNTPVFIRPEDISATSDYTLPSAGSSANYLPSVSDHILGITPYTASQPPTFAPARNNTYYPPQNYHIAPNYIQPLYISQYMLFQQDLIQQQIPVGKDGNVIINMPLSTQILQEAKYNKGEEFTHLRYTPITCSPNDFPNQYTLRAKQLNRETKIAIVCTMYNEDEVLFSKSMMAIFENIRCFCEYYRDPDFWKYITVVIVSDGRSKINPRTLTVLAAMGCYSDGLIQTAVNGDAVNCHMFESSAQSVVDRRGSILTHSKQFWCPVQTIFLLKEQNAKKINSHRWFFNAICAQLKPEVTMLLDVGTKPTPQSFLRLWRCFERDSQVGGACGEISAELGPWCGNVFNPLVAAQNFEYKMSNILDKPLESVFGFISVLPGAFSAYRYRAILGDPLNAYFRGESMSGDASVSEANMYLAEDRILCFEIVAKKHENWVLKYVRNAVAETDVPDTLPEFISQRRRWLNGSFFAAVHALMYWMKIYSSSHSLFRKLMFTLQFFYNLINILFSWFSVGNFFLAFYFLFDIGVGDTNGLFKQAGPVLGQVLIAVYLFLLVVTTIISLGNRPQGSKWLFFALVVFFAAIMGLMIALGIYTIIQQLIAIPTVCNIHDTTWGTKGDNGPAKTEGAKVSTNAEGKKVADLKLPSKNIDDIENAYGMVIGQLKQNSQHPVTEKQSRSAELKQQDYFKQFRTNVILMWLLSNTGLIYIFTHQGIVNYIQKAPLSQGGVNPYLTFLFWSVAGLSMFRFIFSMLYLIIYWNHQLGEFSARPKKNRHNERGERGEMIV